MRKHFVIVMAIFLKRKKRKINPNLLQWTPDAQIIP